MASPRAFKNLSRKLSSLNLGAAGFPTTSPSSSVIRGGCGSPLASPWVERTASTATAGRLGRRFFHSASMSEATAAEGNGLAASSRPLVAKTLAEGSRKDALAFVMHGLLGRSANMTTFSRSLTGKTGMTTVGLDLRGHGSSGAHYPAPHTLEAAAGDLIATCRSTGQWPSVLIGHSMGGKVLLNAIATPAVINELLEHSPSPSKQLSVFILDSYPGTKTHNADPEHHPLASTAASASVGAGAGAASPMPSPAVLPLDGVGVVLSIVKSAPFPIPSRQWVMDRAAAAGLDKATGMWLASNVTTVGEASVASHNTYHSSGQPGHRAGVATPGFRWAFDPEIATALFNDYLKVDLWPLLTDAVMPEGVRLHIVTASRSSRWRDAETKALIERSKAAGRVRWLPIDAGHWVHADNPNGLLQLVAAALEDQEKGSGSTAK